MYAKRFPIPEFNRDELKDLPWTAPSFLSKDEVAQVIARQRSGDASACGGYHVGGDDELFAKLKVEGDHRHAVMCVLPDKPVKLLGRSCAWALQRAILVDSLDAERFKTIIDWRTPRPMNTRLGPEEGVSIAGAIVYAICSHKVGDHWIGNRTCLEHTWRGLPAGAGLAVLSGYNPEINDFHDCNLYFSWA
jgi:hypothetical protein